MAESDNFTQYVKKFTWKGLSGRYWRAPAKKEAHRKHLIVVFYGHHSSLERNAGLLQDLRHFGTVLMFDIPGFGGMGSFYQIGLRPTLDQYARFTHQFLSRHVKKGSSFTVIGFSFGFLVLTRFLDLYPIWQARMRLVVSVVGFLSQKAFSFPRSRYLFYVITLSALNNVIGATLFRYLLLNRYCLKLLYARTPNAKHKFKGLSRERRQQMMELEIRLWHDNDVLTWIQTGKLMLTCDLTACRVKHDLHLVAIQGDQYLNAEINLRDCQKVYNKIYASHVASVAHAPTVIANEKEAQQFIPKPLRAALMKAAIQ